MIRMKVHGLVLDMEQQPIILLQTADAADGTDMVIPISIGAQEATSILVALQGASIGRPLSHDLMARLLVATDSRIDKVTIPHITGGTFYAELTVTTPHGEEIIDARPSDAIALASRVGAPIWVSEEVFADAAIMAELDDEDDGDGGGGSEGNESARGGDGDADDADSDIGSAEQIARFREFVEHVDPDEFREGPASTGEE